MTTHAGRFGIRARESSARSTLGAVAAALLVAGSVHVGAQPAATQHVQVRLEGRQVVAPADRRLVVRQGSLVQIEWRSDERGELHIEGYDVAVALSAEAPTFTRLEARASGRFPITAHGFGSETGRAHDHRTLLHLEVHPR